MQASDLGMRVAEINPDLIRAALIMLFFVGALLFRASELAKRSRASKRGAMQRETEGVAAEDTQGGRTTLRKMAAKGASLEMLREAMRQAEEQTRAQRGKFPSKSEPLPVSDTFQQPSFQQLSIQEPSIQEPSIQEPSIQEPPKIEPETSFLPSLLLLALVVSLCLLAYRYWAG
jgi:hypothetical protein